MRSKRPQPYIVFRRPTGKSGWLYAATQSFSHVTSDPKKAHKFPLIGVPSAMRAVDDMVFIRCVRIPAFTRPDTYADHPSLNRSYLEGEDAYYTEAYCPYADATPEEAAWHRGYEAAGFGGVRAVPGAYY